MGGNINRYGKQLKNLILAATFLLSLTLAVCPETISAAELVRSEYRVKAAFLYNFAKLVEWPTNAFASATAPIKIGVLGKNPFDGLLTSTVKGKLVEGRPIQILHFEKPEDLTDCHILFICQSETERIPAILKKLQDKNVLTVADAAEFADSGGMIQLIKQREAVRFEINTNATTRAGLSVSARLLQLATELKSAPPEGEQ